MAKFTSIWGDLDIRDEAITSVEKPKDERPPTETKTNEPDAAASTSPSGKPKVEEPSAPTDTSDPKPGDSGDKGKTNEEEEYEYTEEDVDKAYGMLEEEGVLELEEEDEFDATPKGLADAIAATVRNKFQKEIAGIPPVVQEFYAHVVQGKEASSFTPSTESSLEKLDMDEESNQEAVLRRLYTAQGMETDDINEEISDVKEAGKLAKKSGVAYKTLLSQEDAAATARAEQVKVNDAANKEKAQKDVDDIKSTIDDLDEIAEFKLDDKKKKEFKSYLFDINPRTGKTQMQENMVDEDRRMKIAFLDFIDFSKTDIEKQVTTKLTKNRRKRLSKYTDSGVKNKNTSTVKTKVKSSGGTIKFPSIFGDQTIEVED